MNVLNKKIDSKGVELSRFRLIIRHNVNMFSGGFKVPQAFHVENGLFLEHRKKQKVRTGPADYYRKSKVVQTR